MFNLKSVVIKHIHDVNAGKITIVYRITDYKRNKLSQIAVFPANMNNGGWISYNQIVEIFQEEKEIIRSSHGRRSDISFKKFH